MTRTKSTFLVLLAVLLSPMAAWAVPVDYDINFTENDDASNSGTPPTGSFTYDAATETLTDLVIGYRGAIFDVFGDELVYFEGGNCGAGSAGLFALLSQTCGTEGSYTYRALIDQGVALIDICKDCFGNGNLSGEIFSNELAGPFSSSGTWAIAVRSNEVPEPGTLALLGLGLVGMAARRRKKA